MTLYPILIKDKENTVENRKTIFPIDIGMGLGVFGCVVFTLTLMLIPILIWDYIKTEEVIDLLTIMGFLFFYAFICLFVDINIKR